MFIEVLIIIIIMAVANCLGTLKTIFVSKKFLHPVYLIVFVDAVIFAMVITKVVAEEQGLYYVAAFALGKSIGVYLAGLVENRAALGLLEADIYFNDKSKMSYLADQLRRAGYSVNTHVAFGFSGKKRYIVETILKRKNLKTFKKFVESEKGKEPTMVIREINNVYGRLRENM